MTTERIAQDCDHFSLPPPAFSGIDEVKADISAFVSSCGLYEEYATKLGELGGEDWISFRGRLYVFEDFVIEWLEKARAAPAGAVADFLKSELAKFRDVAPLLKYVRGEPFPRGGGKAKDVDDGSESEEELCDFELQRKKNIERNQELLRQLGLA